MGRFGIPLAALIAACGGGGAGAREGAEGGATSGGERVAFETVVANARERYPGETPVEVEVDTRREGELLEVELLTGEGIREVFFDPATGAFVREEMEDLEADEAAQLPALRERLARGDVTLENALEVARRHYVGEDIREVELEMREGTLVIEIEVRRGGEDHKRLHDAATGQLLGG